MNNYIYNLKKRLIYRSQYRGTKEMDKLIGSFVDTYINELNFEQLHKLETFLNIDDDTLYKFYNNQLAKVDLIDQEILKLFKKYNYNK